MPTSQKKIEANRRNAQKSTGPKSLHGKSMVRLNALRHGIFASPQLLLPGEDRDQFATLQRAYRRYFKPATQLENGLVDHLILSAWNLARLSVLEPRLVNAHCENSKENSDPVAHAYIRDSERGDTLTKLHRKQANLERSFYRALDQLQQIRVAQNPNASH